MELPSVTLSSSLTPASSSLSSSPAFACSSAIMRSFLLSMSRGDDATVDPASDFAKIVGSDALVVGQMVDPASDFV